MTDHPQVSAIRQLIDQWREIAKERKRHNSSQWIWGEGAIYDKCADDLDAAQRRTNGHRDGD